MRHRILLVEDEERLAAGLALNFDLEGWEVELATTLAEARALLARQPPALLVLDLNLPDGDGLELLEEAKAVSPRLAVLVLTARGADEDRIAGLRLGADDYVTKPFRLEELVLRLRNLLRRAEPPAAPTPTPPEPILIGDTLFTPSRSTLERGAERTLLTSLELALLLHLWRRRGSFVSREELLVEVWGYARDTNTRTVDIFISRLRRMLGDAAGAPALLFTRRGAGYMLAAP